MEYLKPNQIDNKNLFIDLNDHINTSLFLSNKLELVHISKILDEVVIELESKRENYE